MDKERKLGCCCFEVNGTKERKGKEMKGKDKEKEKKKINKLVVIKPQI